MNITEIMTFVKPILITNTIGGVLDNFIVDNLEIMPVIDAHEKFIGALTINKLIKFIQNNPDFDVKLELLVDRNFPTANSDMSLNQLSADSIPVVVTDSDYRVLGVITLKDYASYLLSFNQSLCKENCELNSNIKELERIIEYSFDSIWVTDGEVITIRVNKGSERISGNPAESYLGHNVMDFKNRGYIDKCATHLAIEKKEQVTISQTVKTPEGEKVLLVTATPIFDDDGSILRVINNTRDVSELNKLRDKLIEEQETSRRYKAELIHLRAQNCKKLGLIYRSLAMERVSEIANKNC